MTITSYVRGQYVTIAATFTDDDGVEMDPTDPVLHVSYEIDGVETDIELDMEENSDGEWEATIDTGPADAGLVYWTIRALGVAKEGRFRLTANPANPEDGTA